MRCMQAVCTGAGVLKVAWSLIDVSCRVYIESF